LELAKYLSPLRDVILVAEGVGFGSFCGIPAISEENFISDLMQGNNIILQISRGDYVKIGMCNVIAQHGPHHILGLKKTDLKYLDAVICVSKFSRKQQLEYGISRRKLRVVGNGIDTSIFSFRGENRDAASFIYAGHIIGYKGIALMLKAFMEVLQHHPEASLHLYGKNMEWNEKDNGERWLREREYLDENSRIDWSQVSKDCPSIQYGGEVAQEELSCLFNRTAFVICSSVIPETFGLVSLEAQACGCIPIYANQGGYSETIMQSTPSLTFEPGNHRSLVRTMRRALSESPDVSRRRKIAKAAAKYSWNRTNKKITSIIKLKERRKMIFKRLLRYIIYGPLQQEK